LNINLISKKTPSIPTEKFYRNSIEVGGSIGSSGFWSADTVKVIGDVIVENGVTLTILPGVRVEFQDYYSLEVNGTMQALGEVSNPIIFTSNDPDGFLIDHSTSGAWNGIKFKNVSTQNMFSIFRSCIFEFSKSFNTKGGVFQIYNSSDIEIINCTFRNNIADYGGSISFEYNSAPLLFGNLYENNYAFISGSPIYCSYSYPRIINNTIVNNYVLNPESFHETAAIHTFISKPQLANNIIWNNENNFYDPQQIMRCKPYYTIYNDIEGGHEGDGNISFDPQFSGTSSNPFNLEIDSPCIDAGVIDIPFIELFPLEDIAGNPRIYNDQIDMGAYEWQDSAIFNDQLPQSMTKISNYPNPFNPSTTISFDLARSDNISIIIYNLKGQKVKTLLNEYTESGRHSVLWNGDNEQNRPVASGLYLVQLNSNTISETRKIMMLK